MGVIGGSFGKQIPPYAGQGRDGGILPDGGRHVTDFLQSPVDLFQNGIFSTRFVSAFRKMGGQCLQKRLDIDAIALKT